MSRSRLLLLRAGLVAAALAAYAGSFSGALVFDDVPAIRDNPTIRTLWPLTEPLSPPANSGVGGRPLANLSFALNYAWGGTSVSGYHAVNLALHICSTLLLFGLLRRTLRAQSPELAALAALLWTLHPLATATVSYISQRTELLMAFFYLATLSAFLRSVTAPGLRWPLISVGACALGMLSKEVMATAPVAVLLYDRSFVAGSFGAAWLRRRPYYLALASTWLWLAITLSSGLAQRSVGFGLGVSAWDYALTEARALVLYLKLVLWPAPLVFDYGPDFSTPAVVTLACAAAVLLALAAAFHAWRQNRPAGFAAVAFFLLLAPTSSFVPIAEQPFAENRMYLPLAVVVVVLVCGAHRFLGPRLPWLAAAAALALGFATAARNLTYRSDTALWTDTVAKRPANPRAQFNLGVVLLRAGRPAEAAAHFRHAIAQRPSDFKSHHSLGHALLALRQPSAAIDALTRAGELAPTAPEVWHSLGHALVEAGEAARAFAPLERALTLRPDFPDALLALGNAHFQRDEPARALPFYERALQSNPDLADAHYNAGSAALAAGEPERALTHFTAALARTPDDPDLHNQRGAALLRLGRASDAVAAFETALRLRPDHSDAPANLALARRELTRAR